MMSFIDDDELEKVWVKPVHPPGQCCDGCDLNTVGKVLLPTIGDDAVINADFFERA